MRTRENFLRFSIAFIFILFGALKFFPHLSPAEIIGTDTVQRLTCSILPKEVCLAILAIFEVSIGVLLLFKRFIKVAILLAMTHLIMTFTPFVFYPGEVFNLSMNSLSLLGQYILKNIIIISALLLIYPIQKNYQEITISK